jgi:hypothetical protein
MYIGLSIYPVVCVLCVELYSHHMHATVQSSEFKQAWYRTYIRDTERHLPMKHYGLPNLPDISHSNTQPRSSIS